MTEPPMPYEAQPPPRRGPGWLTVVLVSAVVSAVVASAIAFGIVLTMAPAPAAGDGGPGGAPLEAAYIWGQAVVTDCSVVPPDITFKVQYVNLGNTSATNVMSQYTVYQFEDPTITRSGTISIGTVAALSSGSATQTVPLECGLWGHNVEVSFTWS